eukprot:TRINITY_DN27602_c0_g1_i5.p1 TRINITY_DN27602_c0_g1~~TRINITY_DN27602_c0_g1_i5.p1  ORF type:complete len:117 (-),score=17.79 TRINITY_DN27602_c0_g1_i5:403-753(-)
MCIRDRPRVAAHCCSFCDSREEPKICLSCLSSGCGRYAQGHAVEHFQESGHAVVCSVADLSFWCYECDQYIDPFNEALIELYNDLHLAKFQEPLPLERFTNPPVPTPRSASLKSIG